MVRLREMSPEARKAVAQLETAHRERQMRYFRDLEISALTSGVTTLAQRARERLDQLTPQIPIKK